MGFPPAAYTTRGGVATVKAAERARWLADQERPDEPDPHTPATLATLPDDTGEDDTKAFETGEEARLAA
jgi:ParB family transcriptional regulator, chromosome partitioning protein